MGNGEWGMGNGELVARTLAKRGEAQWGLGEWGVVIIFLPQPPQLPQFPQLSYSLISPVPSP
ncbi:MAG: hypothetical protein KME21_00560 [Desmonostoc vinosum HA7617-LM4]|jgi:hypothetical protein|nr:hypothetical protein [Desmonostoc vinosum HA7617-LM4]